MSISFIADITVTASTLRDGYTDSSNDEVYVVNSAGPDLRVFNLTTQAQRGSTTTVLASPTGITFLNSSSSVVVSGTSATYDLVENASLYRQNYSSGNTTFAIDKGQQISGNTSSAIAFASSSTAGNLIKFSSSFPTPVSTLTPSWLSGGNATTIILKGSNWLVGTTKGQIVEIDSNSNQIDILTLKDSSLTNTSLETPIISGLSLSGDTLAIMTVEGKFYVYSWSAKTKLYETIFGDSASATGRGTVLCEAASCFCVFAQNKTALNNNVVVECDFTQSPPSFRDTLFLDATGIVPASGINTSTGRCWVIQQTANKIRLFDVTPRTTTGLSSVIQRPAGTNVKGRLIRLIDNGVGDISVELDTAIDNASTSFPTSTGETIIEIAMNGSGVDEQYGVSTYTT